MGAIINTEIEEVAGLSGSLVNSLIASAMGCSRPYGPQSISLGENALRGPAPSPITFLPLSLKPTLQPLQAMALLGDVAFLPRSGMHFPQSSGWETDPDSIHSFAISQRGLQFLPLQNKRIRGLAIAKLWPYPSFDRQSVCAGV